jgi:L-alanine-DL-glutamate epimerase-like enolase superfamily enzyme
MSLWDAIRTLPVAIESCELEPLSRQVSSAFVRRTTVVHLHGAGRSGAGEDVTYDEPDQLRFAEAGPPDLRGTWTLESLARAVGELDLFGEQPGQSAYRLYRRWAFESAALDLGLRQAGTSLAGALGRQHRPVHFVTSTRLEAGAGATKLRSLRERFDGLRFKLDPTSDWDDALVAEIAALRAVDIVDLKGAYKGTPVDQPADPGLYARVAHGFPDAWIEDPDLSDPAAAAALDAARDRITWDAPIHSVADVEALADRPRALNVKPSRVGGVEALLALYDHCEAHGIHAYGGGQFELGPGRGQIQHLASLFSPDAPNDVAPGGYNDDEPADGLPSSPLGPAPEPVGFGPLVAGGVSA